MHRTVLYLPFNTAPRGQWILRRNSELVGQFATREEAMQHAQNLIHAIRSQPGHQADLKVEDESGVWRVDHPGTPATTH